MPATHAASTIDGRPRIPFTSRNLLEELAGDTLAGGDRPRRFIRVALGGLPHAAVAEACPDAEIDAIELLDDVLESRAR